MKVSTIDGSLAILGRKFSIRIGTRNDLSGTPYGAYLYWHPSYDPEDDFIYWHSADEDRPPNDNRVRFGKKKGWSIGFYFGPYGCGLRGAL